MNLEEVACGCLGVTNRMIKEAVDSGASTVEEVQDITGAGTACGICIDTIRELTEQFLSEKK